MSITGITPTGGQPIPPPAYRREEYTVKDVVLKFFEEKAKDVAKAFGYTSFWVGHALPNSPQELRAFGATMGEFKNFVSATEVPKKALELWESLSGLWSVRACDSDIVYKARLNVFKKATGFTNAFVDSIDFSSRFVAINSEVMKWFKGISFAATASSALNGIREQVNNVSIAGNNTSKTTFHMINGARDVSYFVLGVIGLGGIVTGTVIAPWMMVACLTSGITWTTTSFFYEKLYDPLGEGKNLNPEAVIFNNMERARRAAITP